MKRWRQRTGRLTRRTFALVLAGGRGTRLKQLTQYKAQSLIRHVEHGWGFLAADHVYKMNCSRMLAEHVDKHADATVACIEVPLSDAAGFGVMGVDAQGRVTTFVE